VGVHEIQRDDDKYECHFTIFYLSWKLTMVLKLQQTQDYNIRVLSTVGSRVTDRARQATAGSNWFQINLSGTENSW